MVRRDPDGPQLCRALCSARTGNRLTKFRSRSPDTLPADQASKELFQDQTLHRLSKRTLRPQNPSLMGPFMNSHFAESQLSPAGPLTKVFDDDTKHFNSAVFRLLDKDQPYFELGLEGLCGCTTLVVVSREAVWFGHFLYVYTFLFSA
jgi:hypothetical protein